MASTRLNYVRRGAGDPLVLIHGIGSRWQVWTPVLEKLAAQRDVIALDLPGFGASPASKAAGVDELADAVGEFVDELGLDRPAYGGSSLGGAVALELASRGKASAVTVFSPVGFFKSPGAAWCRVVVGSARRGAGLLKPMLATRPGRIALCGVFYGHPGRLDPGECVADAKALIAAPGFVAARRALGQWRLTRRSPELESTPVTVAWGTRDLVLPYRQAARARAVLPRARHVRLAGCGHLPFADDPNMCARLLLNR